MTDLDPREAVNMVEALLNAMPKPDYVCKCGKRFDEHYRLGKRNIWVCVATRCPGFEQDE